MSNISPITFSELSDITRVIHEQTVQIWGKGKRRKTGKQNISDFRLKFL